jgi:hypothetical protein
MATLVKEPRQAPQNATPRGLYEKEVVDGVCRFLKKKGFRITQCVATNEHGEDIKALAPDRKQQVTIEAKGATSSRADSNRYGLPFNAGQVRDHVANAVYCAARYVSTDTLTGVAFPKNDAHVKCVGKILPALKKLGKRIELIDSVAKRIAHPLRRSKGLLDAPFAVPGFHVMGSVSTVALWAGVHNFASSLSRPKHNNGQTASAVTDTEQDST